MSATHTYPMRKIVDTETIHEDRGAYAYPRRFETLECGHQFRSRTDIFGKTKTFRRRCKRCNLETLKDEIEIQRAEIDVQHGEIGKKVEIGERIIKLFAAEGVSADAAAGALIEKIKESLADTAYEFILSKKEQVPFHYLHLPER